MQLYSCLSTFQKKRAAKCERKLMLCMHSRERTRLIARFAADNSIVLWKFWAAELEVEAKLWYKQAWLWGKRLGFLGNFPVVWERFPFSFRFWGKKRIKNCHKFWLHRTKFCSSLEPWKLHWEGESVFLIQMKSQERKRKEWWKESITWHLHFRHKN